MDIWTRIRRDILVEKVSRREACRKYNLNFRTIQKILKYPEPPERPKGYARAKPKIGPFISVIHEILEADKKVHPKQRHTGQRIFGRLRDEHGYTGGITVVRDEIRRWKQQSAEVFMPLAHPPREAQFDFGEAKAVYRGREIKVMSLPYSDAFFFQAFPRECTETFQEGHVRAFNSFGGVPHRISYTASTCFVTFVFPAECASIENLAKEYYANRDELMAKQNEGLTQTYNRFHDPHEKSSEIAHLRELHETMDRAALEAYGWDDLARSARCEFLLDYEEEGDDLADASGFDGGDRNPKRKRGKKKPWRLRWPDDFRDEVLARLLELNEQRWTSGRHAQCQLPSGQSPHHRPMACATRDSLFRRKWKSTATLPESWPLFRTDGNLLVSGKDPCSPHKGAILPEIVDEFGKSRPDFPRYDSPAPGLSTCPTMSATVVDSGVHKKTGAKEQEMCYANFRSSRACMIVALAGLCMMGWPLPSRPMIESRQP
ncbi:MAG: transposase [Pirellulaceae bacterium]|nr:transposase [Pirellulaceae bacterium]